MVFLIAGAGAPDKSREKADLQEKVQIRQDLLQQMCAALRSIASEDAESSLALRQMASACLTALSKAQESNDAHQQITIIEEALSHREKWMTALTEMQEKRSEKSPQGGQQDVVGHDDSEPEPINSAKAVRDIETLKWWLNEHPLGAKQAVKLADPTGLRLTHWAASAGQLDSLKFLVSLGANPWEPTANQDGQNSLHVACISGHTHIVEYLLQTREKPSGAVDSRDAKGMPCLHRASTAGHVEIVQALGQAGSDMNLATERTGSALHGAAAVGQIDVVKSLLALRADPCVKNENGKTPLDRAVAEDEDEIVLLLKTKSRLCKKQARKMDL